MRSLAFIALSLSLSVLFASAAGCGDDDTPGTDVDSGAGTPDAGPDAGDGEVPLDRDHAGGTLSAIAFAGDHAYIATGPTVAIWDIGNPETPGQVGISDAAAGNLNGLVVADDVVYAT